MTAGEEAAERCSQALTVAATAAAAGVSVSLWLTGESVWLAVANGPGFALDHAADPIQLVESITEAADVGCTVTVCTQCAARRGITLGDLRPGVRISGAASFVEEILGEGVTALVY